MRAVANEFDGVDSKNEQLERSRAHNLLNVGHGTRASEATASEAKAIRIEQLIFKSATTHGVYRE